MAENENKEVKVTPAAETKPAKKAENKPSFFKRVGLRLGKFWREYKSEMKKIVWYDRKSTMRSTVVVLVSIIVSAIVLGVLDFGFAQGIMALGKLV